LPSNTKLSSDQYLYRRPSVESGTDVGDKWAVHRANLYRGLRTIVSRRYWWITAVSLCAG